MTLKQPFTWRTMVVTGRTCFVVITFLLTSVPSARVSSQSFSSDDCTTPPSTTSVLTSATAGTATSGALNQSINQSIILFIHKLSEESQEDATGGKGHTSTRLERDLQLELRDVILCHCYDSNYKKLSYRRGTARCVVSCQLPRNSAETTYTTSPDQIDGMKLEI